MLKALSLLDASKEIVPPLLIFLVLQVQAIRGRLIRVETKLEFTDK